VTSTAKENLLQSFSRPTLSQVKGKTIRRILISINHPDTLRLILTLGIDPDSGDAAVPPDIDYLWIYSDRDDYGGDALGAVVVIAPLSAKRITTH